MLDKMGMHGLKVSCGSVDITVRGITTSIFSRLDNRLLFRRGGKVG